MLQFFFVQALSIISVSLLAVENLSDISPLFVTGVIEVWKSLCQLKLKVKLVDAIFMKRIFLLLQAIAAALLMNIYIVGLNQLSDIEIDKVRM